MTTVSKFRAAVVCAVLLQTGVAFADPSSTTPNQTNPPTTTCPKGMVMNSDHVCVKPKSGQMGFDLPAPSDDSSSSSSNSGGNSRSVSGGSLARAEFTAATDLRVKLPGPIRNRAGRLSMTRLNGQTRRDFLARSRLVLGSTLGLGWPANASGAEPDFGKRVAGVTSGLIQRMAQNRVPGGHASR